MTEYRAGVEGTAKLLNERLPGEARVAIIAGSGLGGFVRSIGVDKRLRYAEIPAVGSSTVQGHRGELVLGRVGDVPIVMVNGRRHLYEGISAAESTLLLRALLVAKPIEVVIISNAAGGLNRTFDVGDLMLITDQVNLTFRNPLIGQNVDEWGPRFPDASELYSRRLRDLARRVALEQGVTLREGVYVGGQGPTYETRAEVAMHAAVFGGDAIGMSTVAEVLVARHMGREVLGISYISNLIVEPSVTTHEEVMANAALVEGKFARVMAALLRELA